MQPDLWPLILCHLKLPEQAIARRIDTASRDAILPTDDFILKRRFSDNAEHLQSFFAYMRRHVFVHVSNIVWSIYRCRCSRSLLPCAFRPCGP